MSQYLINLVTSNMEAVEGKDMNICGETVKIGALNEEEKEQMIKEGVAYGNQLVEVEGKSTKIIDIDDGRVVVATMEVGLDINKQPLEGNSYSMWYPWRGRKIKAEWEKLNEVSQKQIKALFEQKGLWTYVEEWL